MKSFEERNPTLTAIGAGVFQYPDGKKDEFLAAQAANPPVVSKDSRTGALQALIRESNSTLLAIESDWQELGRAVFRDFKDSGEARAWLVHVVAVWEKLLREVEGGRPS